MIAVRRRRQEAGRRDKMKKDETSQKMGWNEMRKEGTCKTKQEVKFDEKRQDQTKQDEMGCDKARRDKTR